MNITNRRRFRRSLALALTFIVSSCAQLTPLAGVNALAAERGQQTESPASSSPGSNNGFQTTADPVDWPNEFAPYASAEGPIVRVALMTDVASALISCSSGLVINRSSDSRSSDGFRADFRVQKISLSSLRVELRKQSGPVALPSSAARYAVFVGSSSEAKNARNLEDRLKLEFFEPVTTTFDEKKKQYVVTIGRFTGQDDAEGMVNRLRDAGYRAPRVVSDPRVPDSRATSARETPEPELVSDTYARAAKYKAESGVSGRSGISSSRGKAQMVAVAAEKVVASSESEFVVSPGDESAIIAHQRSTKSDATSTLASLRVGNKDYRGTIHFIVNPRGRINVVNVLPLEQYLRGVVPLEMSATAYSGIEAIKAQAVASRSFALASLGQHRDEGYDLVDDSRSQVYGGLSAERELTNQAVEQTRGIVASYQNDAGKLEPIQALYTTNCGGRTENNEEVFGGKALPYLRSVACVTERQSLAGRDIVTTRTAEPLNGTEGRSIIREAALLTVLGFSLPRRASSHYLRGAPDQDEARGWTEQLARLTGRDKPASSRADITKLAEFTRLVAAAVYGEDRTSKTLASADVEYLLAGLRVEQLSREGRADVAMLLKDGVLRLAEDGVVDGRATITRAQAIETIGRAILLGSPADLKSQTSNLKSRIPDIRFDTSAPSEKGRLILAKPSSPLNATRATQGPSFVSVNTSSSSTRARSQGPSTSSKPTRVATSTMSEPDDSRRVTQGESLEISEGAWLFRAVGGESYAVDRLTLIGGERVTYHLNGAGRVDFLEASISERGGSIDRLANVAPWQERVTIEELQQRLARGQINVGRPEHIEPAVFSASSRITEVELSGTDGHARLHITQIRGALGLKEHLFAIDREIDGHGRLVAFVFTGRGSGHGVGMCQAGAYRLAKEGYSYTAILQKYYTGIEIQKTY
jgi:peptidoglycan hydrolase-like amidase